MNHTITLESIHTMTIGELANLPASELMSLTIQSDKQLKQAKLMKGWIDSALRLKYEEQAKGHRQSHGRETGIVHFTDDDIKVTATLPKKVTWDQDKLKVLAKQIQADGDDIDEFLDVKYNIPEHRYTAWPSKMRHFFNQARSFSHGKEIFKLQHQIEEDAA